MTAHAAAAATEAKRLWSLLQPTSMH